MSQATRPVGITRTLPYFGAGDTEEQGAQRLAYRRMMGSFWKAEHSDSAFVRIAFAQKPVQEVLHCYLIVGGRVRVRANISHWEVGTGEQVASWDGHDLSQAKYWAILTAPVSYPPEPFKMRGHQGIRYVYEDLW